MDTSRQQQGAAVFRRLHARGGPILVLPNVWDAASARLAEASGARAVATSSGAVSWAQGATDGEGLDAEGVLATARVLCRAVRVPVTVDLEAGYGDALEGLVRRLVDLGVAGINLEDGTAAPAVLTGRLERVRRAVGDRLFVNARTDVFLRGLGAPEGRVEEVLGRARVYREAGADGLFVPGLAQEEAMGAVAQGTALPLNVMLVPGLPPPARLQGLGVQRLSVGTALAQVAFGTVQRACRALLEEGAYGPLLAGGVGYSEMNALFRG